jgi:amidase
MTEPHPESADLAYASAHAVRGRLEAGELTSAHFVETLQSRIGAVDGPGTGVELRAIAALADGAALDAHERDAERSRGRVRGALHGLAVVVKDNVEARGLPGAAGSTALSGRPAREAPLVARLREAGAIVLGSTNLSEWANIRSPRSSSGWSAAGGLVVNPWALDRTAGGSSSGSGAALAAGLAPLAVGTETDGSIVCPASVNGVAGLKPTVGVVPATHVVPVSSSQDSPGPMARTVDDLALLFGVLAALEAPGTAGAPLRASYAMTWRTGHPATDAHCDAVVAGLSGAFAEVARRDVAVPGEADGADELTVLLCELFDDLGAYLAARPGEGVRSLADVVDFEDEHAGAELAHFGHEYFTQALDSGGRAGEAYAPARERNLAWAISTCLEPALEGVDVLLAPAYAPAWKIDLALGDHAGMASPATMAPAIAGWPIASVPLGLVDGLPVGMAVIGRPHCEWTVLEAARRIERVVARPFSGPTWRAPARG